MSTINIGGQEVPVMAIAVGLPVIAACWLAYDGYFAEESLQVKYDSIQTAIAEVDNKRQQAEELKQRTKEIDKVKAEIAELEKGITLLRSKIPSEAQVPVLLYDIEKITKSSQGDLATFQPGELRNFSGDNSGDIQELPVNITASATFPQIIAFMDKLNSYERKLSVSNISLAPTGTKPDLKSANPIYANTLNMTFTLNAYVLRGKGVTP
jgi:type IV pilus assembly protein PilO